MEQKLFRSFCRFRWFWHFYGAGLVVHTPMLIVTVYSVLITDKFPTEVSLILSYVRTPASDKSKDKIKHCCICKGVFCRNGNHYLYLYRSSYGHNVFAVLIYRNTGIKVTIVQLARFLPLSVDTKPHLHFLG